MTVEQIQEAESKAVFKLFNDCMRLTKYTERKPKIRKFNEDYKLDLETGELSRYTFWDGERYCKYFETSLKRTKRVIKELSDKNKFDFFLTVTFIDGYVNRKNSLEVHAKFKNIMKRLKYRFGNIEYLAVPEFHKDRAIHYHVMINFERKPKLKYDRSRGIWHFYKSKS